MKSEIPLYRKKILALFVSQKLEVEPERPNRAKDRHSSKKNERQITAQKSLPCPFAYEPLKYRVSVFRR